MQEILNLDNTGNSKLTNQMNISIIFNYLLENEPISRADLSRALKISAPAVSRVINKLIKEGYAVESKKIKTKSGKRPTLIEVNKEKDLILCIDLSKENMIIALVNIKNEIIHESISFKITNAKSIINKIITYIKTFLSNIQKEKNINFESIGAICIGVPANIDIDTGIIKNVPLYNKWEGLNFTELLYKEFDKPVYTENDVNLSAIGEKFFGIEKEYGNIVFIEISSGIGAALIIDGKLFRGSTGTAGEIGYSIIKKEDIGYDSKYKGFLEKNASIESIKTSILSSINLENTAIFKKAINNAENITPHIICNAAKEGIPVARRVIKNMVDLISISIINLILIVNPQIVILGGQISVLPYSKELFLNPIIENVEKTLPFKRPEIKFSILQENACILGASYFGNMKALMMKFPYRVNK